MSGAELIHDLRLKLWDAVYTNYINNVVFSTKWFIMVGFLILMYFIWWKLVDKSRLPEMLIIGSFAAVISAWIDVVGTMMQLWMYASSIVPFLPALFPFDFTSIPIAFMLAHQYAPNWRSYAFTLALASSITCFVIFPAFHLLRIIILYKWNFIYTFVLMMFFGFVSRYVLLSVYQLAREHQHKSRTVDNFELIPSPASKPTHEKEDE